MPFCTFVEKWKYCNNRKYENKQSENAEDEISADSTGIFFWDTGHAQSIS